jgi:cytochrome bd-type quinol oxidase subunit 2
MKQHTKMYLLSALIVLIAVLTGLLAPSDGAGAVQGLFLFLLAVIAAAAALSWAIWPT